MSNPPTFQQFQADALARGFDEVLERKWGPDVVVEHHTHPFAVEAVVVQGEMWLTVDDDTCHLKPGDTFALEHAKSHAERYGADGATYWAARRATVTAS